MKLMYSTEPHNFAHEVEAGIYAMPVHTSSVQKMKALGWVRNKDSLAPAVVPDVDDNGKIDRYDQAASMGIEIYDDEGKKVHWRKIDQLIEDKLNEHNES